MDLAAISPVRQSRRLQVPTLIAHGKQDLVVPVEQGERMIRAVKEAGIPNVEHVIYPKLGHDFDTAERRHYLERVEAFLLRHNPPGDAATPSGGVPYPDASR